MHADWFCFDFTITMFRNVMSIVSYLSVWRRLSIDMIRYPAVSISDFLTHKVRATYWLSVSIFWRRTMAPVEVQEVTTGYL